MYVKGLVVNPPDYEAECLTESRASGETFVLTFIDKRVNIPLIRHPKDR